MLCRHCRRRPISRPRKLCWSCFYNPSIRVRYPARAMNTSPVERFAAAPSAPWPTKALPGTPEKIEVLRRRAEARQSLWHPGDA